jgi:hypothetical protein
LVRSVKNELLDGCLAAAAGIVVFFAWTNRQTVKAHARFIAIVFYQLYAKRKYYPALR